MRITVQGIRAELSVNQQYEPERWNNKTGRILDNKEESRAINNYLENVQFGVSQAYRELSIKGLTVTAENIKNIYLGKEFKRNTLLGVVDEHNQQMESSCW